MASVTVSNVRKSYGDLEVVHGLDLAIADGAFVVLLGPSGCGKSTLLRMIAGLEPITAGEVKIGADVVNDLHPKDRNIAMVFQNYALYAHMTVFDNMAFSMQLRKLPKEEIAKKVEWAASILNLTPYLKRYPRQLSGGQRQRVAMGRAIVRDPAVFLFDEPLSNLDAKLRVQMRTEIKELHQRLKTTTVYVTHDQIEAMTMADVIVILRDGYIEQVGAPLDVYDKPANLFVAEFIGSPNMNILRGEVVQEGGMAMLRSSGGPAAALGRAGQVRAEGRLRHPARTSQPLAQRGRHSDQGLHRRADGAGDPHLRRSRRRRGLRRDARPSDLYAGRCHPPRARPRPRAPLRPRKRKVPAWLRSSSSARASWARP
jgi:multiple sugar transport system ATP-binding protein